ncbi:MAG: YdcF family protein [Novosphingobium sp.]|nr:YdcF family protein [Novosphingobium sp.]
MTQHGIFRRLAALLLIGWALGFVWFSAFLPQPVIEPVRSDGVVALTGAGGRIPHALDVVRKGHARRLLVSGVDREVRPREFAVEYKVPAALMACCVTLGYDAVDTRSNAIETVRWIKENKLRSVRLVTTDWHMRRAAFDLAAEAPASLIIVRDAVPSQPSFLTLFIEYNKLVARLIAQMVGW